MNDQELAKIILRCGSDDEQVRLSARAELRQAVNAEAVRRVLGHGAGDVAPAELKKIYLKLPPPRAAILDESERIKTSDEVNQGFSLLDGLLEANRCIQCEKPGCQLGKLVAGERVGGCPVGLRIPDFIAAFCNGDIRAAYRILMEDDPLHRITARVCPQDEQCQATCALCKIGAISIGLLERIVGDWYEKLYSAAAVSRESAPTVSPAKDFPIALVGSGPASLTAAIFLARKGYRRIFMFEAFHQPAGVLRYGIPEFRLPRPVINEVVNYVQSLGVRVVTDVFVGRTLTIQDLKQLGFRAFFLGTGAGLPVFMKVPGEELNGVISANEFLTRCNLMEAVADGFDTPILLGKKIVVVGGGNVAMDAARWARRLAVKQYGADKCQVILLYRRTKENMPARSEEIDHAIEEGIEFVYLAAPTALLEGEKKGWVGRVQCQRMVLSDEKDRDGRNKIKPVEGPEGTFFIDGAETVIEALGTRPNAILSEQNKGLEQDAGKVVVKDPLSGRTSVPEIFVGGDASRGGATVILAMGDGKNAAEGIDQYLQGLPDDARQVVLDEALLNIKDWFQIRDVKVLATAKTKDGRVYALKEMVVYAPLVAARAKAGQFVMVMIDHKGERVPLTLADWDQKKGTITLVFQEVGVSTYKLGKMSSGDKLFSLLGPLGHFSVIEKVGDGKSVVIVGGGVGIAPVYPIARAHHDVGNKVFSIIGARNQELLFWEDRMASVSDELIKTFDDQGEFVTHALERLLRDDAQRPSIAHVVAVGPVPMMENVYKTVARVCAELGVAVVPVIVSLNPTMMDGTGMCGGCRLMVKGSAKYGCVDGPEFDAALVDFEGLKQRQSMYVIQERCALDKQLA